MGDVGQFDDASDDEEELLPVMNELRANEGSGGGAAGRGGEASTGDKAAAPPHPMNNQGAYRQMAMQRLQAQAAAQAAAAAAATRGIPLYPPPIPTGMHLGPMHHAGREAFLLQQHHARQAFLARQAATGKLKQSVGQRQDDNPRVAGDKPLPSPEQARARPPSIDNTNSTFKNTESATSRGRQPSIADNRAPSVAKKLPEEKAPGLDRLAAVTAIADQLIAEKASKPKKKKRKKKKGSEQDAIVPSPQAKDKFSTSTPEEAKQSPSQRRRHVLPFAEKASEAASRQKRPPSLLASPETTTTADADQKSSASFERPQKRKKKKHKKSSAEKITMTVRKQHPTEGPVILASQLVGKELRNGLWPSPFCNGVPQDEAFEHIHERHMKTVAGALESFAKEVILPSMQQQQQQTGGTEVTKLSKEAIHNCCLSKPFVGTLLALREVMTQNGLNIFGRDYLRESVAAAGPTSSGSSSGMDREEEVLHSARVLATAVTVAAIESYMKDFGNGDIDSALDAYFSCLRAYDGGDDAFARHLQPDRGDIQGVLPNGNNMEKEENVARSVSFNYALKRHPIVVLNEERKLGVKKKQLISSTETNVCHVAIFEDT